jgi:hypothetical protein
MSKISYSQFSKWDKCPYTWKLDYVDKETTFYGNIYTLFGTAVHETIQAYLVAYYNKTIKIADSLPLRDILQYRMEENYKISKEQHGDNFEVTLEEMKEFFNDGCKIVDEFLKRKSSHFPKKNTELVGIEIGLDYNLPKNMKFVGYMDVVLHNKVTGRIKIIDIKTATMGWNKYQKADKNKTNQLLLYKQFFAKEREIPIDKIDIEYLILKRRLYENMDFPQKRIQVFSPASGKPSINRVITRLQEFMTECYDEDGNIIDNDYQKCEKHKKCRMCKDL